jgi:hypothetical protein
MLFDRPRLEPPETAEKPRRRFKVIATAIGGDTWDVTIPELMGTSTVALSAQDIEPTARHLIATKIGMEPDEFDIDERRIEYPAESG